MNLLLFYILSRPFSSTQVRGTTLPVYLRGYEYTVSYTPTLRGYFQGSYHA